MTDAASDTSTTEPEEADHTPSTPAGKPEDFALHGSPPLVMRLSRKTMAVIGIAAGVGIGGSLMYALHQGHPVAPPQNIFSGEARAKSELVTGAPADYSKVPKLGRPLPGDLGRPILDAQANGETVPVPPMGSQSDPRAAVAEQARQRLVQERDAARSSRLFLGGSNAAAQSATPAAVLPIDGGQSISRSPAGVGATSGNGPSEKAGKREFLKVAANRPTENAERLTAPVSPYVVQAGSIIPAALITGIRSDLPGQITAQVTENVYDSPTGRILLIPQGSRLIGEYDSQISAGQNRVLLAWDRLIMPDGRSILLDRQPGADARGFAGLQDGTNYHWGSMLKAALVSTLLGVGTEFATNNDDELLRALRYGSQDTINQTGRHLVQRQTNVAPTITIRPGFPLLVLVTRDLVLEPISGGQ